MHSMLHYISLHATILVVVIAVILFVVGWGGCRRAIRNAGSGNPNVVAQAQVSGSLYSGILTGAFVAVGVLVLQQWIVDANADAVWRANVQAAASIPGFAPAGHSLQDLILSGKDLHDAQLYNAPLETLQLQDTNLLGANLRHAHLQGANLLGADLRTADLGGTHLQGANLKAARFDFASVEHAASFAGAHADAATCWPRGFLELPIAREIIAEPYGGITIRGLEYPQSLKPRRPLPKLGG